MLRSRKGRRGGKAIREEVMIIGERGTAAVSLFQRSTSSTYLSYQIVIIIEVKFLSLSKR